MDDEKTATNDVDTEMVSMMFAAALWHMEHAQWVSLSVNDSGPIMFSSRFLHVFITDHHS